MGQLGKVSKVWLGVHDASCSIGDEPLIRVADSIGPVPGRRLLGSLLPIRASPQLGAAANPPAATPLGQALVATRRGGRSLDWPMEVAGWGKRKN
jgi:hypothetical protein